MDITTLVTIVVMPILTIIVQRILAYSENKRSGRKDLREEIEDLWKRVDTQDAEIKDRDEVLAERNRQRAELVYQVSECRREIANLHTQVEELMYYKQRYTAAALDNERLARQVGKMQEHINKLEKQVQELQTVKQAGA